ncbi:mycothiol synthase [Mycetocola sp. JXN-3]|uniref:mycothiol synthase n=1 Tax=Mycetocola sp. JXN-3 TaxID=2116510 RepID=UPI00165CFD8C|nr:mycothiol synthase [Mycetocola sp. JXN-3]
MSRQIRTDRNAGDIADALDALIRRAQEADRQPPFNDQSRLALAAGNARLVTLEDNQDALLGAAIIDGVGFEAVIDPAHRGHGHGTALIGEVLAGTAGAGVLSAWAHGDHPAAAALARVHEFERARVLYRLERELEPEAPGPVTVDPLISTFLAERDADDWVSLNARVFRDHPEQGALLRADLDARTGEDWFDPENFLLVRDDAGHLIGYNWLKVLPGDTDGEIYVLGVAPETAGQGLGRRLMNAGLARFAELGLTTTSLYVDDSNPGALGLYRSLGYRTDTIDVQYHRPRV